MFEEGAPLSYIIVAVSLLLALLIIRCSFGNTAAPNVLVGVAQTAGMREIQADACDYLHREGETLLVAADGIGSGEKGRIAARVAADTIGRQFEAAGAGQNPVYFFRSAFQTANAAILRHIPDATAGACLLAAVIQNGSLYYALAGNCSLFVFRGRKLYSVSVGQTMDKLAYKAFQRKQISRAEALEVMREHRTYNFVGKDGFGEIEQQDAPIQLKAGDLILLMTDGVGQSLTDKEISEILRSKRNYDKAAKGLIYAVEDKKNPEQDNASVVLARIRM